MYFCITSHYVDVDGGVTCSCHGNINPCEAKCDPNAVCMDAQNDFICNCNDMWCFVNGITCKYNNSRGFYYH